MDEKQNRNTRPADVIRDGALKATIWENDGEKGPYFTTKLAKTYEDRDGKLRDTDGFSSGDLLRVSELAREAYARTRSLRRERQSERQRDFDDHANGGSESQDDEQRGTRRGQYRDSRRSEGRGRDERDSSRERDHSPSR